MSEFCVPAIVIEPPTTEGNFVGFNVQCEELDSDFLMQPVNEADYDSETQACVDARTGGPSSYYDHFVTRRKKKKFFRGNIEAPVHEKGARTAQPTAPDSSMLMVPNSIGIPKGALSNVAVRRIACGRMPPMPPPSLEALNVVLAAHESSIL